MPRASTAATSGGCDITDSHDRGRSVDLVRLLQGVEVRANGFEELDLVGDANREPGVDRGDPVVEQSASVGRRASTPARAW